MKTLIVTSIYGLLGTPDTPDREMFTGRMSRESHYKWSLLSILSFRADKIICYTSADEMQDLDRFFYEEHDVSRDALEFRPFALKETKHFKKIQELRAEIVGTEGREMELKQNQRCFEVQYNKFFWMDYHVSLASEPEYDRVYWFDAGLSHTGLFPKMYYSDWVLDDPYVESYQPKAGSDVIAREYYPLGLFNNNFLNHINRMTKEKIIVCSKNNTGRFYWAGADCGGYTCERWVVGAFFGGKPENCKKMIKDFSGRLQKSLDAGELPFEEFLMTHMFGDNPDDFAALEFDDWYWKGGPCSVCAAGCLPKALLGKSIKQFYEIFLDENTSPDIMI